MILDASISFDRSALPREHRYAALRRHGDFTLAYCTAVQPGLRHFGDVDGYLAYETHWGYAFALGDPVAPPGRRADLIRSFLAAARRPVFVQCSEGTARVLHDAGLYVNEMGVDTALDFPAYDLRGRSKEWLRHAGNWVAARGYRVEEAPAARLPIAELDHVSRAWRTTRSVRDREVRFLNRPFSLDPRDLDAEPAAGGDVRYLLLRGPDGRLAAFVVFDPLYRGGGVVGYVASVKRRHPSAPTYAEAALMRHAIALFRDEGRERLTLGLSPLANVTRGRFRSNAVLYHAFTRGYRARWLNRFYPVAGHAAYKQHFRGAETPTYFASAAAINTARLVALMRLSRVL